MPDAKFFWDALEAVHFLRPWWLLALLPTGLLAWLQHRAEDPLQRFGALVAPHLLPSLIVNTDEGRRRFRPVHLIVMLLVLGSIGAAGPTWQREPSPFAADTAPVMIAIDLSQAMDAIDVAPSRLERAKQKVRDYLDGRAGAKTGLLAYAGSAHLVLPPTEDAATYATFLDALSTALMPVPGSAPLQALGAAQEALDRQDGAGTIVFVTGSMDTDTAAFTSAMASRPHQVLALAVGTETGGPVRVGENQFLSDSAGRRVIAQLDPGEFSALRDAGLYTTRATVDNTDIQRLLDRTASHLEDALEEDAKQRWMDAGYWLAWPVVVLALFWSRRGWTVRWDQALAALALPTLLLALPLGGALMAQDDGPPLPAAASAEAATPGQRWADLWWTPDQQGRRLFEAGDFEAAAARFEDPYWRGVAAYRGGNWSAAIDAFAGVTSPAGSYNLGNSYARNGDYELAIAAYDQALIDQPAWDAAIANRALVVSLIPPPPETEEQGTSQPTFKADEVEFDLEEDQGETGEVEMAAFSDDQMAEMWLNQLTTSPAGFLRTKFAVQAARAAADAESAR
jgi:Ca-activated chloride channel family protein